jgi:hypothetical protein
MKLRAGEALMARSKKSNITRVEFRDRLKATGLSHAMFAHEYGYSLDAVRLYLMKSATRPIPYHMERALIKEEGWHGIDLLIAAKGKRASKYKLKAIRDATKIETPPPKRRRAKRKPRKTNWLAPRFLRRVDPGPVDDPLIPRPMWLELAQRVGAPEAQRLYERLASKRPTQPRRLDDDPDDRPARVKTTII